MKTLQHEKIGTLAKVGVAAGGFLIFVGAIYMLGGTSEAKSVEYVSRVPALQTAYDEFERAVTSERCKHVKGLAKAKLEEDMYLPMAGIDRNDLALKRDMSCDF